MQDRRLPFHERFKDRISLVTRTGAHIRIRSEGARLIRDEPIAAQPPPEPKPWLARRPRSLETGAAQPRRPTRRQSESAHSAPPGAGAAAVSAPATAVQPHRTRYKPYSLQDYRQLPERVVLGRLGPDLDSDDLAAKRIASYRMQEFSRGRRVINLNNIRQAKERAATRRRTPPVPPPKSVSSRHRALEFAARLQPPKPRRHDQLATDPGRQERDGGSGATFAPEAVLDEIDQLTRQHERHKSQVDAIRKEMRLAGIDNGR